MIKIFSRRYSILFAILILSIIVSCSKNNNQVNDDIVIEVNGAESDYNNLNSFLKTLPDTESDGAETPHSELKMFIYGRNLITQGNYKAGFEALARLLYTYPSSYYEPEASYLLGQAIIYLLEVEPLYIGEYYKHLNTLAYEQDGEEFNDLQPENFSLSDVYDNLGIVINGDKYSFNGTPFSRIVRDNSSTFMLKDFAYYFSIRHRFSKISLETDKARFNTNVRLLKQLSDRYRTSPLQNSILQTKEYFPSVLPFTLNPEEKVLYTEMLSTISNRISMLKPQISEPAYVIGNGVIMRDRIPLANAGFEQEVKRLNDYDFVTILLRTNLNNTRTKENEDWLLVRYDTFYGSLFGWSYAQYFTNDKSISNTFNIYSVAMTEYNNYNYMESARLFSQVLNEQHTNYFTDKAAYFLWRANNKIGELVSSKNSEYYKYVVSYPKYFFYNTNTSVLHSSTLLYNYLIKTIPDSPYKFRISGDSETDYLVD